MNRKLTLILSMLALAANLLTPVAAHADTLTLVLSNPVQNGKPGSILNFFATASAPASNGGPIDLAGDSFSLDVPLTLDDSGFFGGFPVSLDPGHTFTGLLFAISLPSSTPVGLYNGSFSIQGDAGDVLSTVTFQVNAVPEPGTIAFLATGLSGLAVAVRRRRLN